MRSKTEMKNEKQRNKKTTYKSEKKYGILAALMMVFLFGGFLLIEHVALIQLTAAVLFCIASAAMLLYALMKMNVMEFQPGSLWYRLNQYVNREEPVVHGGKRVARSMVYAMIMDK